MQQSEDLNAAAKEFYIVSLSARSKDAITMTERMDCPLPAFVPKALKT